MDERELMEFQMSEKIGRLLKLSREKQQVTFKGTTIRMAPCFSSAMLEDKLLMTYNFKN